MKESNKSIVEGLPYIAVLRAFNRVVESCFGMQLAPNYKEHIARFSLLYRELEISVTPKVSCHSPTQPNSIQVGVTRLLVCNPPPPPPPDKLLDQFQGTQEADFRFVNLIQPN